MTITGTQTKAARELLGLSRIEFSVRCDIPYVRIVEFESGRRMPSDLLVARMKSFLETAGVEFTNGGKPGVRLKAAGVELAAGNLGLE